MQRRAPRIPSRGRHAAQLRARAIKRDERELTSAELDVLLGEMPDWMLF